MKTLAIILLVLGFLVFAFPVISFVRKEKVLDIGPVEVVAKKHEMVSFAPLLGVTFLAVGGAILVAGAITGKR
jgi:hypothetical protein